MINSKKNIVYACLIIICTNAAAWEGDEDQSSAQQNLNAQILSQPFNVADETTLDESLSEATKRGKPTKSEVKTGQYQYFHNGYYYPYWAYSRGYWY
ncbi:hypothetical protein [Crenothrix polyspora]|uniref:Uncharacterized protein n=1 Tax=Crenothrix polyspora TaxID=360316 RepID=A0A1R4HE64_9GAMM|nr:hypothetical protein [Crenothrix polyspora]SJM94522.1 exported hypothetical protein [Crenothrix polyspora]